MRRKKIINENEVSEVIPKSFERLRENDDLWHDKIQLTSEILSPIKIETISESANFSTQKSMPNYQQSKIVTILKPNGLTMKMNRINAENLVKNDKSFKIID